MFESLVLSLRSFSRRLSVLRLEIKISLCHWDSAVETIIRRLGESMPFDFPINVAIESRFSRNVYLLCW